MISHLIYFVLIGLVFFALLKENERLRHEIKELESERIRQQEDEDEQKYWEMSS